VLLGCYKIPGEYLTRFHVTTITYEVLLLLGLGLLANQPTIMPIRKVAKNIRARDMETFQKRK
jgi:hypothetical protein